MNEVSVVIPAYNPGERLRVALESVFSQDADLEVIVVDDGSTEDLSWIKGTQARYIRQDNAGVSVARNVGIAACSADLVAFIDQDDEWLPNKITRQLATIGATSINTTDFYWCPSGVRATHPALTAGGVVEGGHFCCSTLLVRREWLWRAGGFNPVLRIQQDGELIGRLLNAGATSTHTPEALARYVLHDSNASQDYQRGMVERLFVLEELRLFGQEVGPGIAEARKLYGNEAWQEFRRDRTLRNAIRATSWSPGTVARSLAESAKRRLNDILSDTG